MLGCSIHSLCAAFPHPQYYTTFLTRSAVTRFPSLTNSTIHRRRVGPDRRREVQKGFLAHPRRGKHIAFDGRYLHGGHGSLFVLGIPLGAIGLTPTPHTINIQAMIFRVAK